MFHTNRDYGDENAATVTAADRDGHEHRIIPVYPGSSDQYTAHHFYPHGDAGDRADAPARRGHSPTPWKVVRSDTPYYTWLMAADATAVCWGFGYRDESVLLAAAILLEACEAALAATDPALPLAVTLTAAIRAARGGTP